MSLVISLIYDVDFATIICIYDIIDSEPNYKADQLSCQVKIDCLFSNLNNNSCEWKGYRFKLDKIIIQEVISILKWSVANCSDIKKNRGNYNVIKFGLLKEHLQYGTVFREGMLGTYYT